MRTMRINRTLLAALGVALAVVCFFALNVWGTLQLRGMRLDLTQNRQYTLAPATEKILSTMDEPITLRLYISSSIRDANPFLWSYGQRVHDVLKAYAQQSRGRITLEFVDPEPFSVAEDRAVGFGLQPVSLENGGSSGYIGLAGTNSTDNSDVIPVLSPDREPFLEYDLTRLVYNLAHPEKPVVALISSLPINGDPALQYRPWQVYQQLGQFFNVRYMGGDVTSFDKDVKLLMLVHPQSLSDKTLYAIDQFVLHGGKAMVFLDPVSEAATMRQRQPTPGASSSSLDKLMTAWGVQLVPDKVVADPNYARQVQFPSGGRPQIVDYLPWLSMGPEALNRKDVITAELNRLNFATAGFLKKVDGGTTEMVPLVTSSDAAEAIDVDKVAIYPDPMGLIRDYKPGGEPLIIAARVSGPVKSAFPDALPEGVDAGTDRLTEAAAPISLVVVADTDMLEDRNWVAAQSMFGQSMGIPVADNANFVGNALDFLAGSEALASLRGRDVTLRPFTKVEEIRRAAELRYRAKEQELLAKLEGLQQKLASVKVSGGEEGAVLSAKQQTEIEGFRSELLQTRGELRAVRHALRSDIEDLRDRVRFADIAAMPIVVAVVAVLLALVHRRRVRRRFDAAEA